uniref:Uncharacterized protein n=1 Tax=Cannabis sativa TaxID=3483 RepID=A0A803NLQ1_CANSA
MYFEVKSSVHVDTLMVQLERCEDKDDVYKLRLCAFIEGVLVSKDGNIIVWPEMLKLVDDLEFFFKYSWDEQTFPKSMWSMNKDMIYYKQNIEKKKGKKLVIKKCVCPRPTEEEYFRSINDGKATLYFEMDIDDLVDDDGTRGSMFETQAKTITDVVSKKEMKELFMAQLSNLMTLLKEEAPQPQPQLEDYRLPEA